MHKEIGFFHKSPIKYINYDAETNQVVEYMYNISVSIENIAKYLI